MPNVGDIFLSTVFPENVMGTCERWAQTRLCNKYEQKYQAENQNNTNKWGFYFDSSISKGIKEF